MLRSAVWRGAAHAPAASPRGAAYTPSRAPSRQVDPETDGPVLPTKSSEEFKPFTRKLPEFKFWEAAARGTLLACALTLTRAFDIPVFWPILVIYFFALLGLTLRDRVAHMLKYRCARGGGAGGGHRRA